MGINGIVVDISPYGITISGTPLGGTRPNIGDIGDPLSLLRIHARKIDITTPVSASGSNVFISPVVMGGNKGIIWIDEEAFFVGEDFLLDGNKIKWLNQSYSIAPGQEILLFGPANDYTEKAFTFEVPDMEDTFIFDSLNQTIKLRANGRGLDHMPYNIKSIYLIVDGKTYIPNTDFTYNAPTGTITWINANTLSSLNKVRVMYYNLFPTYPFRLGDALVRFTEAIGPGPTTSIPIVASVSPILANASNILLNTDRKRDLFDYKFNSGGLSISWISPDTTLANLDKVDISYFRDLLNLFGFFTEILNGTQFSTNLAGDYETVVTNFPVETPKGLLFHNGLLCVGPLYDAVNGSLATTAADIPTQYSFSGNTLIWDPDARVPSVNLNQSDPDEDVFVWNGFTDRQSRDYIRMEYFKGTSLPSGPVKTLSILSNDLENVDAMKTIVWYNQVAYFKEFGEIDVSGTKLATITLLGPTGYTAPDSTDDIMVMFFTNESYADFWKFQGIQKAGVGSYTLLSPLLTFWGNNQSVALPVPVSDIDRTMLFIDGVKADPRQYQLDPTGSILTNLTLGNVDGPASATPSNIMLVHF